MSCPESAPTCQAFFMVPLPRISSGAAVLFGFVGDVLPASPEDVCLGSPEDAHGAGVELIGGEALKCVDASVQGAGPCEERQSQGGVRPGFGPGVREGRAQPCLQNLDGDLAGAGLLAQSDAPPGCGESFGFGLGGKPFEERVADHGIECGEQACQTGECNLPARADLVGRRDAMPDQVASCPHRSTQHDGRRQSSQ